MTGKGYIRKDENGQWDAFWNEEYLGCYPRYEDAQAAITAFTARNGRPL